MAQPARPRPAGRRGRPAVPSSDRSPRCRSVPHAAGGRDAADRRRSGGRGRPRTAWWSGVCRRVRRPARAVGPVVRHDVGRPGGDRADGRGPALRARSSRGSRPGEPMVTAVDGASRCSRRCSIRPAATWPSGSPTCVVRDRIVAKVLGVPEPGIPALDQPTVIVANDLAPADTATLDLDHVRRHRHRTRRADQPHRDHRRAARTCPAWSGCTGAMQLADGRHRRHRRGHRHRRRSIPTTRCARRSSPGPRPGPR